jgi:hypothetical protein
VTDPFASPADSDLPAACVICGGPLGVYAEDQPDWPTGPICGNCYQSQQLDDELAWSMDEEET